MIKYQCKKCIQHWDNPLAQVWFMNNFAPKILLKRPNFSNSFVMLNQYINESHSLSPLSYYVIVCCNWCKVEEVLFLMDCESNFISGKQITGLFDGNEAIHIMKKLVVGLRYLMRY